MTHTCIQCNETFDGRADAQYCSSTCRANASKARTAQESDNTAASDGYHSPVVQDTRPVQNVQPVQSVRPVQSVQPAQIVQSVQPAHVVHSPRLNDATPTVNPMADEMLADVRRYKEKEHMLEKQIQAWQEHIVTLPSRIKSEREKIATLEKESEEHREKRINFNRFHGNSTKWSVKKRRSTLFQERDQLKAALAEATNLLERMEQALAQAPLRCRMLQEQLRDVHVDKCRLYQSSKAQFNSVERTLLPAAPPSRTPAVAKAPRRELTAGDILNTNYESFTLRTDLGQFMGDLDRNKVAIALTGDSDAGKSHFAFELARLFSDEGFSTKFFCLEEGEGKLTQDKIRKYNLSDDVRFAGTATLQDVRRDAALFDVIIVDSFTKLDVDSSEFEKLRTDFPTTIFILVFQKATSGGMRGGSSILFNSSAAIDVRKDDQSRYAEMTKSRYGTIGWVYDIDLASLTSIN